ncbi:hypothetical protein [Paenibacillus elgii]|uniref:hypothetical protein n=1 Tax=Paenibacillus elgii TaxID=189691 RepID=UPI00203D6194|nr:hypothetical protein [Paenibacillus elgii]MCM3270880.1 hypothetical protein [Paenibacillus elgii]
MDNKELTQKIQQIVQQEVAPLKQKMNDVELDIKKKFSALAGIQGELRLQLELLSKRNNQSLSEKELEDLKIKFDRLESSLNGNIEFVFRQVASIC